MINTTVSGFRYALASTLLIVAVAGNAADSQRGIASYYADSLHGNPTASGEPYDKNAMTAAHKTYPFGSEVTVTYLRTGKSVQVRINDRGPHVKDRIIDLSAAAAEKIGLKQAGVGEVTVELVE